MEDVISTYNNPLAEALESEPDVGSVPTISSSAMLVQLNISQWGHKRKDRLVSNQVADMNGAKRSAGKYDKELMPEFGKLIELGKFVAMARKHHSAKTTVWSDMGMRLVTTQAYPDYVQSLTALENEFNRLVDQVIAEYPWEITKAKAALGNMYDASLYPTEEVLRSKYSWTLTFQPIPDAGDLRVDLPNEALDTVKQGYKDFYTGAIKGAMNDLWKRLHNPAKQDGVLDKLVKNLEMTTDEHGNEKPTRTSEGVFEAAIEMCRMMRDFNVTKDTQMEAIRHELESALGSTNVESLRNNMTQRETTRLKVEEVISKLPSLNM